MGEVQFKMHTIEHFMDRYIPITIQKLIAENMHAVLNSAQMSKFETFQILKYRFINEMLLEAEQDVDLKAKSE